MRMLESDEKFLMSYENTHVGNIFWTLDFQYDICRYLTSEPKSNRQMREVFEIIHY